MQGQLNRSGLDDSDTNWFRGTFEDHHVQSNGRIQMFPILNFDAKNLTNIEWAWDGTNVIRRDRDTDKKLVFVRASAK